MTDITVERLASIIDASIGGTPAATYEEMHAFFEKLDGYKYAAVMIEPCYVKYAAEYFHNKGQKVVTVISYPLGAMNTVGKVVQAEQAVADGVDELDVAMDLSAFRSGDYKKVVDDLKAVKRAAGDMVVKAIYFSAVLTEEEAIKAAELAYEAGIDFLKTNPGYGYVTRPEHISAIKRHFGEKIKVMASGGVRTYEDAVAMIEAGADRIATSSVFAILGGGCK